MNRAVHSGHYLPNGGTVQPQTLTNPEKGGTFNALKATSIKLISGVFEGRQPKAFRTSSVTLPAIKGKKSLQCFLGQQGTQVGSIWVFDGDVNTIGAKSQRIVSNLVLRIKLFRFHFQVAPC